MLIPVCITLKIENQSWTKNVEQDSESLYLSNFRIILSGVKNNPAFMGSQRKQRNSRKTHTSAMQRALTEWMTINWKILKEMGTPDHLTCVLRNLYVSQEATVKNLSWNN